MLLHSAHRGPDVDHDYDKDDDNDHVSNDDCDVTTMKLLNNTIVTMQMTIMLDNDDW